MNSINNYYSAYVAHMIRHWFACPRQPESFNSEADRVNWTTVDNVLATKSEKELKIIERYFCYKITPHVIAEIHHATDDMVYTFLKKTIKEIAKNRKLI